MAHEELELVANVRDFTTLFSVILRRESSEWLESSIKNDLDILFGLSLSQILLSLSTPSSVGRGYEKDCLTSLFS